RGKTPASCRPFPPRTSRMPFDPKLVHPDQPPLSPAGDLDLPDDLAALAQQLANDAAHLSASYPPSCPKSVARLATARPRFATAAVGSSAAVIAAAVMALIGWQFLPAIVATSEVATTVAPSAVDQSVTPLPSSSSTSSVTPV